MKEPTDFNRMGSATQAANSVKGEVLTVANVTYEAGKFGNGMRFNANNEKAEFQTHVRTLAGTFECWIKPNWDSSSNSTYILVDDVSGAGPSTTRFLFYYNGSTNRWRFSPAGPVYAYTYGTFTWSLGDWFHIAGVWDSNGINGTANEVAIYINGTVKGTASGDISNAADLTGLRIGLAVTNNLTINSLIDNVKIYDYAKIDFSDRFNERGGLNDQIN